MNIRDSIKKVKISLISVFLICTSSFNYYACNCVEEITIGLAEANRIEEEMHVLLDKIGAVDPLHFACGLNRNLAKKFTLLLNYENVVQNNLEILRNNMGDKLFGTLLSTDNIGARLKRFIGYEPDKPRTLGEIELRYKIVLERCGIPFEGFINDYQEQVLESKRLEMEGKRNEKTEVEERKAEMEENINKKYLATFSNVTLGEQGKTILSRLDKAQNNIFVTLETLDRYIKAPEGQAELEKYQKQLEEQLKNQQEESKKQIWQSNRYDLIVAKLRDRLAHLESIEKKLLELEKITPQTVTSYLKYFNFLNDCIYTVADISYLTAPAEIKGCIDDFVFPQPLTGDNSIIILQRDIGQTQINLSMLRELVLKSLIADFPYSESTEEQPLINNFNALGIHEKLYAYSLNLYHIKGRHKARIICEKLGFTREDAGILEAKLRWVLTKTKGTKTTGKKRGDNIFGEK